MEVKFKLSVTTKLSKYSGHVRQHTNMEKEPFRLLYKFLFYLAYTIYISQSPKYLKFQLLLA